MLHHNGRQVRTLRREGRQCSLLVHQGRQIYPGKRIKPESIEYRTTDDGAEKWFEVGWKSAELLTGNAGAGWTDARGYVRLELQRSEDLVNWSLGQFIDCAGSPTDNGDGTWTYWARMIFPIDSMVKTGQLSAESNSSGGDARNNPFTSLVIDGVTRALGGFPYTMPGDAARMQADMRANGLTGALCVASSNIVWRIDIPNINFTSYALTNKLGWPGYLIPDMFGALTITLDGVSFSGEFLNAAGVRTAVPKQFARMAITPLHPT